MPKIRIAFVKFGGLSAGGTERWLQIMAANLPKDKFDIDYFYCDSAPYIGSDYKHADTDLDRLQYMLDNKVNLIKFNVGYKDVTVPNHDWVNTDFWEKFDENKYDIVQSAKAGPSEYPFNKFKKVLIVDSIHLFGVDNNPNIVWSCFLSEWSRMKWCEMGGDSKKSSVISAPIDLLVVNGNMRGELNIPIDSVVAGYHQRPDNNIASDIPLKAFSKIENKNWHFIIMGGGDIYRKQAKELNLKNIHFLDADANPSQISSFLNTLDIFAHGRKDGETFGTVFAEAMMHGLPCLTHKTEIANAQEETMNKGGLFALDLDDYTSKLKSLFENEDLRKKLGNFGRAYAEEHYSVSGAIKRLCNVYENVLLNSNSVNDNIDNHYNKSDIKSFKCVLPLFIKRMIFNKYFFICYRFLKKLNRGLGRK